MISLFYDYVDNPERLWTVTIDDFRLRMTTKQMKVMSELLKEAGF